VGDTLTLQVLGRTLTARISGLRRIEWSGFGVNLPVVLNSGSLKGAALRDIAIIRGERRGEDRLLQVLGRLFPGVNAISVRDQLNQVSQVFEQLAWAVRGAAAVAALAGLLVLIGAVAASAQARTREAALLKVLGSTRPQILAAYAVEYGVVGVIAGAAGLLLGGAAAYPVVVFVFKAAWSVDWAGLGLILAAVAGVGGAAGALGATLALSRRPGPALRAE
jgi:putative ABC transport system permease protein